MYFYEVLTDLKQGIVPGWKYEPQMSHVRDKVCECFDVRCKRHLPENNDRLLVNFYNFSAK